MRSVQEIRIRGKMFFCPLAFVFPFYIPPLMGLNSFFSSFDSWQCFYTSPILVFLFKYALLVDLLFYNHLDFT